MALASARPDCLVSSSGADYKAWSEASQNCNDLERSAASQRLASHKPQVAQPQASGQSDTTQRLASHKPKASQLLIRGWLATNWLSINKVLVEPKF